MIFHYEKNNATFNIWNAYMLKLIQMHFLIDDGLIEKEIDVINPFDFVGIKKQFTANMSNERQYIRLLLGNPVYCLLIVHASEIGLKFSITERNV